MVQSRNKELDVALELFNSELEKLKLKEKDCLLYTSDAADDLTRVDLGGRRIIKK